MVYPSQTLSKLDEVAQLKLHHLAKSTTYDNTALTFELMMQLLFLQDLEYHNAMQRSLLLFRLGAAVNTAVERCDKDEQA